MSRNGEIHMQLTQAATGGSIRYVVPVALNTETTILLQ